MASIAPHNARTKTRIRRGTYHYMHQPVGHDRLMPTGIVEHFSITPCHKTRKCTVQVTRDATKSPNPGWLSVEALLDGTDISTQVTHFTACWQSASEEAPKLATYDRDDNQLFVETFGITSEHAKERLTLPHDTLMLPLMRIFLGPLITSMVFEHGGEGHVMVPTLDDVNAPTLFSPNLSERKASLVAEELSLAIGNRNLRAHLYKFVGGNYGEESAFWIDPVTQMLLRYEFVHPEDGSRWQVELG